MSAYDIVHRNSKCRVGRNVHVLSLPSSHILSVFVDHNVYFCSTIFQASITLANYKVLRIKRRLTYNNLSRTNCQDQKIMPIYNYDDCVYGERLNPHTGTGPSINRKKMFKRRTCRQTEKHRWTKGQNCFCNPELQVNQEIDVEGHDVARGLKNGCSETLNTVKNLYRVKNYNLLFCFCTVPKNTFCIVGCLYILIYMF